jgi:hypothetical protein
MDHSVGMEGLLGGSGTEEEGEQGEPRAHGHRKKTGQASQGRN